MNVHMVALLGIWLVIGLLFGFCVGTAVGARLARRDASRTTDPAEGAKWPRA